MLAGLIFATDDADDRPGTLAATLPFGGLTLIEFQARLLVGAGASQIVLVVARLTPELLGAINRIARRGVPVDAVRTAAEVIDKLHPLARILAVADGLATTGEIVELIANEPEDALLVTDDLDDRYGRIGALTAWAGLANLDAKRIAEVAALPRDYDFQSTLLRVAAQSGADQIRIPAELDGAMHRIERDSSRLMAQGKAIQSALVPRPVPWADRYVLAATARFAMPQLMERDVPAAWLAAGGAALAAIGFAIEFQGWRGAGLFVTISAMIVMSAGAALASAREERQLHRYLQAALPVTPAVATLLLGLGDAAGIVAASATIIAAALVERAGNGRIRRRWWASPAAYPVLMLPFTLLGVPLAGLIAAGIYASVTLAAAIEAIREKP